MNGFYEITKRDVREYEMAISAKDREMELMEENHRVEVRVSVHVSLTRLALHECMCTADQAID